VAIVRADAIDPIEFVDEPAGPRQSESRIEVADDLPDGGQEREGIARRSHVQRDAGP
jgi:hypothetical protein